ACTRSNGKFSLSAGEPKRRGPPTTTGDTNMTSTVTTAADLTADTAPAVTVLSAKEQEEIIRTHMPLVGHLVRDMPSRIPTHRHHPPAADHHARPDPDQGRAGPGARHHDRRPAPDRHRRAARHRSVAAGLHHEQRRRPGHREDAGPGGHAAAP